MTNELQLSDVILPLAGGMMMGAALVLLYFMLRRPQVSSGEDAAGNGARWKALLGFVLGVPAGVYVVLQVVGTSAIGPAQSVLVGLVAGACLTYVLARRPMRQ